MSPFWISLGTASTATAITFAAGIAAARAMSAYKGKARGLLDGILILPLVLPPTVVGFFLLLLFGRRSAIGHALEQIGITVAFSWPATVIAATVVAFPLMYRTALGAFEQVSPNLIWAARTLGASEWRTFARVMLPLAWPGIMAGAVLSFARALGEFGATLMLAGNIPGRTQTMPVAIFFAAESNDMHGALLWIFWIALLSLATIAAMNHVSRPANPGPRLAIPEAPPPASMRRTSARNHAPIEVDLYKRHPGFDLSVNFSSAGGTLGVLGASGSGKSMTLRCIAGLETPDRGRIVVNGRVLFDSQSRVSTPVAQRRIGMVFQDYALFPHMTVRENIAFGLRARSVEEWARLVEVETLLDVRPSELSGGQRQRVALARALAMQPAALLLDEPFAALDPHLRRRLEEHLRELLNQYEGAAVFVTHDRDEAYRLCDELVVLSQGRIEAAGPRRKLFAEPATLEAARVTGCRNLAAIRPAGDGRIRVNSWNCTLRIAGKLPAGAEYIGIRAHHIRFVAEGENTFPCHLVDTVESPFEVTVFLRIGSAEESVNGAACLEAELPVEEWRAVQQAALPLRIQLPAEHLLLLAASCSTGERG
jgi:molybdate transport system permease protein